MRGCACGGWFDQWVLLQVEAREEEEAAEAAADRAERDAFEQRCACRRCSACTAPNGRRDTREGAVRFSGASLK